MAERLNPVPVRESLGRAVRVVAVGGAIGGFVGMIDGLVTGDRTMVFLAGFFTMPASGLGLVISELLTTKRERLTETVNALTKRS